MSWFQERTTETETQVYIKLWLTSTHAG